MITLCLDEVGHFELEKNDKIKLVGGAVYIGEDYQEERERIKEFLKVECEKAGGVFPKDLHMNHKSDNGQIVKRIKKGISSSIEEYLRKSGKYIIVAMVKSRKDREEYKNISNLIDDSVVSNLYEHMICALLNNVLFSNIFLEHHKEVNLEIPTRLSVIPLEEEKKIKEFKDLGYKKLSKSIFYKGKESYGFYSTDEKTFKAALSSLINSSVRRDDTIFNSINIQSINYDEYNENMAFLYFADYLCSNISFNLDTSKKDFHIENLYKWAKEVTLNDPFIWGYDDIDILYSKVIGHYYKKDFIEFMEDIYDSKNFQSEFAGFYNKYWFSYILSFKENAFDINKIESYINKLDERLKSDIINQYKVVFIFDALWKLIEKHKEDINEKKYIYRVADVGIRAYNHLGDIKHAEEFFDVCKKLKDQVDIQEYLDTVNRVAVIYADQFNFIKALELAKYNLECLDILKKAKLDMAFLNESTSVESVRLISRGRALSSIAQYLSYMRDEEALKYFEDALKEFTGDEGNSAMTRCFLLHFAIDQKKKELYEQHAMLYFGSFSGLEEQFQYVLNSKNSYALYAFVKALNEFYYDNIPGSFIEDIKTADYKALGFNVEGHPWELIYKYFGILSYRMGNVKSGNKHIEQAINTIVSPSTTIKAINYFTDIENRYIQGDKKGLASAIKRFDAWLNKEEKLKSYFEEVFTENEEKTYENLKKKFTFNYV